MYFCFPLSECPILIFTYMLLLPEGQTGEVGESLKEMLFRKSANIGQTCIFAFLVSIFANKRRINDGE